MKAALLLAVLFALPAWGAGSEADYTAEWCELHDMVYDAPGDGRRPPELVLETATGRHVVADCISPRAVVEVDFAHKYHEGVGQALEYGMLAERERILLLIITEPGDCRFYWDAWRLIWRTNQRIQLASTGTTCRR